MAKKELDDLRRRIESVEAFHQRKTGEVWCGCPKCERPCKVGKLTLPDDIPETWAYECVYCQDKDNSYVYGGSPWEQNLKIYDD